MTIMFNSSNTMIIEQANNNPHISEQEGVNENSTTFENLPTEIFWQIFEYLDIYDLTGLTLVSKPIRNLALAYLSDPWAYPLRDCLITAEKIAEFMKNLTQFLDNHNFFLFNNFQALRIAEKEERLSKFTVIAYRLFFNKASSMLDKIDKVDFCIKYQTHKISTPNLNETDRYDLIFYTNSCFLKNITKETYNFLKSEIDKIKKQSKKEDKFNNIRFVFECFVRNMKALDAISTPHDSEECSDPLLESSNPLNLVKSYKKIEYKISNRLSNTSKINEDEDKHKSDFTLLLKSLFNTNTSLDKRMDKNLINRYVNDLSQYHVQSLDECTKRFFRNDSFNFCGKHQKISEFIFSLVNSESLYWEILREKVANNQACIFDEIDFIKQRKIILPLDELFNAFAQSIKQYSIDVQNNSRLISSHQPKICLNFLKQLKNENRIDLLGKFFNLIDAQYLDSAKLSDFKRFALILQENNIPTEEKHNFLKSSIKALGPHIMKEVDFLDLDDQNKMFDMCIDACPFPIQSDDHQKYFNVFNLPIIDQIPISKQLTLLKKILIGKLFKNWNLNSIKPLFSRVNEVVKDKWNETSLIELANFIMNMKYRQACFIPFLLNLPIENREELKILISTGIDQLKKDLEILIDHIQNKEESDYLRNELQEHALISTKIFIKNIRDSLARCAKFLEDTLYLPDEITFKASIKNEILNLHKKLHLRKKSSKEGVSKKQKLNSNA